MLTADVKRSGSLEKKVAEKLKIKTELRIGFFKDATYDDGKSVAYIAYLNEYGGHNPARPFMKETCDANSKKWLKGIRMNVMQGGVTQGSLEKAFDMCGMVGVGDVVRTIQDWPDSKPQPNAESTIKAKERRAYGNSEKNLRAIDPNKVLVDSTTMISNVRYEVIK